MNASPAELRVELLLGPGHALGVVASALDLLNTLQALAHMRQPLAPTVLRWRGVTADGRRARLPTGAWPHLPRAGFAGLPDVLIVPGWHVFTGPELEQRARADLALLPHLRAVHARGGQVLAVGTGVALPALAGLLDGVACAVPWAFMPTVSRLAPQARLRADSAWVHEAGVGSCDAPSQLTALLLRALHQGPLAELAEAAAQALLPAPERQQVAAQLVAEGPTPRLSAGSVERARRWLQAHLAQPYDLQALAREAATSARSLLRHFEAAHGVTPYQYHTRLRVARAKVLLETTYLPVEQVAQSCGYADVGTFRRVFARHTGSLPAQWRAQHRLRTSRRRWRGPDPGP